MKQFLASWRHVVPYLLIVVVFVWGLRETSQAREEDARIERSAALTLCADNNKRTAVIREFVVAATADPNPAQYDFIVDPVLRQGVIDSARAGRAVMRARVIETFKDRDCAAELPAPPNGN